MPDVRDRQTLDAHHCLMPPALGAGHNKFYKEKETYAEITI